MPCHGPNLTLGGDFIVKVQLQRAMRFVVLAHPHFGEFDADDMGSSIRHSDRDALLRWNAQEIVNVVDTSVFDKESVAAETRSLGEDHTHGAFSHFDLSENLV